MLTLIISDEGHSVIKNINSLPRVGDYLDLFYSEGTEVVKVLHSPVDSTLCRVCCDENVDIIVYTK